MNPTEQYDGIMFLESCKALSKLRIGTKYSGLMRLVVPLPNQEWSVGVIKTERLLTPVPEPIQPYFL